LQKNVFNYINPQNLLDFFLNILLLVQMCGQLLAQVGLQIETLVFVIKLVKIPFQYLHYKQIKLEQKFQEVMQG